MDAAVKSALRDLYKDLERDDIDIISFVQEYTMTSIERVYVLLRAADYLADRKLEGDIVECGVWRGGSMMALAIQLVFRKSTHYKLWLYDTFEGMPRPTENDFTKHSNENTHELFEKSKIDENSSDWCRATLVDVQLNLSKTRYPESNIKYIKGKVEDTIPAQCPEKIALLRLDTDWYESTKHELEHLFPRLVSGGMIIIDDYGHWEGCRKAVDEYFEGRPDKPFLFRLDYTGRAGIKP